MSTMTLGSAIYVALGIAGPAHAAAGQRYGEYSYTRHLLDVMTVGFEFGIKDGDIITACLLHDLIEDTDVGYTKIAETFNDNVANIVQAVTDPPGLPNRKARKAVVYQQIKAVPGSLEVKLCDRIANVRSCWRVAEADKQNKSLLGMYKKEYGAFRKALREEELPEGPVKAMWDELDLLLAWRP